MTVVEDILLLLLLRGVLVYCGTADEYPPDEPRRRWQSTMFPAKKSLYTTRHSIDIETPKSGGKGLSRKNGDKADCRSDRSWYVSAVSFVA